MLSGVDVRFSHEALNQNMGSLFHGALMEMLEPEYVERLHRDGLNPYSQCLVFSPAEKCWVWRVRTLDEEAAERIAGRLAGQVREGIRLKRKDLSLKPLEVEPLEPLPFHELVSKAYGNVPPRRIRLTFATPASFKHNGSHVLFPRAEWILASLIRRLNAFSDLVKIGDEQAVRDILESVAISDYRLQSTRYHLERVGIKAFKGHVVLALGGNETLRSLATVLLRYGEYAGIGVKTSMGMGGIRLD